MDRPAPSMAPRLRSHLNPLVPLVALLVFLGGRAQAGGSFQLRDAGFVWLAGTGAGAAVVPARFEVLDGRAAMVARDASGRALAVQETTVGFEAFRLLLATETSTTTDDGLSLPVYEAMAAGDGRRERILGEIRGDGAIDGLLETVNEARRTKLLEIHRRLGDTPEAHRLVDRIVRPLYLVVRTRGGIGVSYSGTGFLLRNEVGGQPVLKDHRGIGTVFVPADTEFLDEDGPLYRLADGRKSGFFVLPVVHEVGHQLMDMAYDGDQPVDESEIVIHETARPTGPSIAFKEGWAEFFEAFLFMRSANFENRSRLPLEIALRQDRAREMKLIYESVSARTGGVRRGEEQMSTEGVVSGLFYNLLTHRKLEDGLRKAVTVFHRARPGDYLEFVTAFLELYPADRDLVIRVFLEGTRYATVSTEIPEIYRQLYQTRRSWLKATGPARDVAGARYRELKALYHQRKEAMFARVLETGDLGTAVGPGLWVRFPDPRDLHGRSRSINLNLATLDDLVQIPALRQIAETHSIKDAQGYVDEYIVADRILEARDRAGGAFAKPADLVAALEGLPDGAASALVAALDIVDDPGDGGN